MKELPLELPEQTLNSLASIAGFTGESPSEVLERLVSEEISRLIEDEKFGF